MAMEKLALDGSKARSCRHDLQYWKTNNDDQMLSSLLIMDGKVTTRNETNNSGRQTILTMAVVAARRAGLWKQTQQEGVSVDVFNFYIDKMNCPITPVP